MDENVCEDESMVVEQSGHLYQHPAIDSSMDNALYANNGMLTPSAGSGSQSTAVPGAQSFISPNITKFK